MSVQSEITRITGNIANAYTAVSDKGGTLPAVCNSANLTAAIESIPSGGHGIPIDVPTAVEMNAVLIADNVGKVYRFTGTTDVTYTNGDLYIVEAV